MNLTHASVEGLFTLTVCDPRNGDRMLCVTPYAGSPYMTYGEPFGRMKFHKFGSSPLAPSIKAS